MSILKKIGLLSPSILECVLVIFGVILESYFTHDITKTFLECSLELQTKHYLAIWLMQNTAVRLLPSETHYCRTTPILQLLHQLPISFCFKMAFITYRVLSALLNMILPVLYGYLERDCLRSTAIRNSRVTGQKRRLPHS